jgi:hypothetical protein
VWLSESSKTIWQHIFYTHGIKKQAKIITFIVGIEEPTIYVTKLNSLLKLHFSNRIQAEKIMVKKCIFIRSQEQPLGNGKRNSYEKVYFSSLSKLVSEHSEQKTKRIIEQSVLLLFVFWFTQNVHTHVFVLTDSSAKAFLIIR